MYEFFMILQENLVLSLVLQLNLTLSDYHKQLIIQNNLFRKPIGVCRIT